MIFLPGTSIMHKNAAGLVREERVQQFFDGDQSLHDYASYVQVDNAATKLQHWHQQGAEIVYLSSHKNMEDVAKDEWVLRKYGFPTGPVFFRHSGEQYSDVAEAVLPDILIEDDAKCIGGEIEMTYPHIKPEFKARIKSIVVAEFGGIDHLPDDVATLIRKVARQRISVRHSRIFPEGLATILTRIGFDVSGSVKHCR